MKVLYGTKGNNYFIMCSDFKEIYKFDMFGNIESTNGLINDCNNWQEVDFLSYIGTGTNNCELLYNGYKAELGVPLFEAINPIRNYGKYLGTMFNVPHEDDFGRYNQILFLFKKGTVTNSMINSQYPNRVWTRLNNA